MVKSFQLIQECPARRPRLYKFTAVPFKHKRIIYYQVEVNYRIRNGFFVSPVHPTEFEFRWLVKENEKIFKTI